MSIINVEGLGEDKGVVFPVVSPGKYQATISGLEKKLSKPPKEWPMLKLTLGLNGEGVEGRKLIHHLVLPDAKQDSDQRLKFRAKLKRLIVASGLAEMIQNDSFDSSNLIGQQLTLVVKTKIGEDKVERNEVDDFLPLGS